MFFLYANPRKSSTCYRVAQWGDVARRHLPKVHIVRLCGRMGRMSRPAPARCRARHRLLSHDRKTTVVARAIAEGETTEDMSQGLAVHLWCSALSNTIPTRLRFLCRRLFRCPHVSCPEISAAVSLSARVLRNQFADRPDHPEASLFPEKC